MARDETPPFARGETYYNGGTIDTADLGGINLEGREYIFEANADGRGGSAYGQLGPDANGRPIKVKVVRNASGVTLKPKRLVKYQLATSGINLETRVDGYTFAVGDVPAGIVDEFLPPGGVVANDLFYVVVDGPSVGTSLSASPGTIAHGNRLVPGAGTSATNNDAGRVALQDLTGATATLGNNIQNCVGRSDGITSITGTTADVPIVVKIR